MVFESFREEWVASMLQTELFEWKFGEDDTKILKLKDTNIFIIAPSIWLMEGDIKDIEYRVIHKFEDVLDLITDKDIQTRLLFYLDLFV